MDAKDLHGRELSAYALGWIDPLSEDDLVKLLREEIERLCAEPALRDNQVLVYHGSKPMSECVVTEQ